eukprot:gnl/MRDRNA2_/MRDRNA2_115318_c0_seq1.p1 gnl/MRDRNA2_/MRDRNA2_115318_c0~~gnl/MRDRNA2_/MRDRNA2_115318_c0_seq1.p1  ORF type:complete len:311 (-),score=40.36 gnl/MRDRNA2_/MRDRNA2_115318_c0_seq1:123-1055(-)
MCLPLFCSPAQGGFCCGSLRRGATVVLFLNVLYGLVMVMLHAYLLSEEIHPAAQGKSKMKDIDQASGHERGEFNWFLQVVDMDLSWGHRLLGFKDDECLLAGLLYGVAVLASCTLALSSVLNREDDQQRLLEIGGGPGGWGRGRGAEIYRPWLPRWFIVFAHSQLIAYIFQVMTKFTQLCELRHDYFPSLEANCQVLRFQYAQRAFLGVAASTLGLYILGSFAYLGQEEVGRSVGPRLAFVDEERPVTHQPQHKVVHSSAWSPAVSTFISRQPVAQYNQYQPINGSIPSTSSTQCSGSAISWGVQEPVSR